MTYTKKQVLPALHHSGKVNAPDMPDVEDKNYTATILKYANLALPFPQLHTNANTIVAAINELYAHPGGSIVIPNPPIADLLETESGEGIETESGDLLEIEQSSGGGGTVTPLTSISIDGVLFSISGGGTTVVANPSGSATDSLLKLQVGNDIYSVSNVVANSGTPTSVLSKIRIDNSVYAIQGIEVTGTLTAGQTTLTINNAKITTSSTFNIYTNPYGAILTDIVATSGKLVLTFEEQQQNVSVKVRIT